LNKNKKGMTVNDTESTGTESVEQLDAIVIGAGITGLYQLHLLRELGLSVRCYDGAGGVGGTWYWNRYPGCRFDSETETYAYSFSEELSQEWDWKEHFSAQPETERYLNYVADKFNLREDIQLNAWVKSAIYDENESCWTVELESGEKVRAQFVIAAVGILSARYTPAFEGIESFTGISYHTSRWPHEQVNFAGKRVAVIGTGSTGIQLIQEIAKEVGQLTVFQRTANFAVPIRNRPVDPETQRRWKATYPEIHKQLRETPTGFIHRPDPRSFSDVSPEERLALYEELWLRPGFAKWLGNFSDILTNREANADFSEFVRNKIRARVNDPVLAEKLVPKDHPFGAKRVPLETDYYEAYNRSNVSLVYVRETPIERITPAGVKTSEAEYEFDIIIYATGFDAISGGLTQIDIHGIGGETFKEKWSDGPRSYLGIQTSGFPNFFISQNAAFCNFTVCAETIAEWISDCIGWVREKGFSSIEALPESEEAWVKQLNELAEQTVIVDGNSWFVGANIPGKKRATQMYAGSAPSFRAACDEAAAKDYEGFALK
jgi:cation diffusion facilitator CzcD-associated flavoprotein CzcO